MRGLCTHSTRGPSFPAATETESGWGYWASVRDDENVCVCACVFGDGEGCPLLIILYYLLVLNPLFLSVMATD